MDKTQKEKYYCCEEPCFKCKFVSEHLKIIIRVANYCLDKMKNNLPTVCSPSGEGVAPPTAVTG